VTLIVFSDSHALISLRGRLGRQIVATELSGYRSVKSCHITGTQHYVSNEDSRGISFFVVQESLAMTVTEQSHDVLIRDSRSRVGIGHDTSVGEKKNSPLEVRSAHTQGCWYAVVRSHEPNNRIRIRIISIKIIVVIWQRNLCDVYRVSLSRLTFAGVALKKGCYLHEEGSDINDVTGTMVCVQLDTRIQPYYRRSC
jgi:hypothetical protein